MVTQEILKEKFEYSEDTGLIVWRVDPCKRMKAGDVAGTRHVSGYIIIKMLEKQYYAHRLAWLYMTGDWPDQIDHINHIKDDNRWANLRDVPPLGNARNRRLQHNNKSGIHGVRRIDGVWVARIYIDDKAVSLGSHKDFFEACCARKSAESKLGYHANHGRQPNN